jgi:salicylate hydroxylase
MSEAPHALLAGAGIGGLTAALCLARAGFRVSIFERACVLQEAGAGLQISPNASSILRNLGVLPRLAGAALEPRALRISRGRDGALLQRLSLKDAESRWGAPYLLIHRADLQRALLATLAQDSRISLTLDSEVTAFADTNRHVEVSVRTGATSTVHHCDCLIGADGLRSSVRLQFDELRRRAGRAASITPLPAKSKYIAWRALVEPDRVATAQLLPETWLRLGSGAHIVHYPLRGGTVINVVAVIDDQVAIDWNTDIWSQAGAPEEIQARFSTWDIQARSMIAAAQEWRKWPLVDLAPLPEWTMGRIALMGDAAHPMLPFLAQGAAQAIEDAAMLGAMLTSDQPVAPCLAAYSAARRARANRVQAASRRQGRIYHLGETAAFFRDLRLRTLRESQFLTGYDWLYQARSNLGAE